MLTRVGRWYGQAMKTQMDHLVVVAQTLEQARTLRTIIIVIGFGVGILCLGVLLYLLVRRNPFH